MARFAKTTDGNLLMLDDESGEWIPATPEAIGLAVNPKSASVTAFLEGATGIVSIAEALSGTEGTAEAIGQVRPGTEAAGLATSVVAGVGLARGASRAARGLGLTNKGAKAAQGAEAAIKVPRNVKAVLRGETPGVARGAAGGLGGAGQAVLEGSQILRGAFPGLSPNIQRQAATNIASVRPFGLTPTASGQVPRRLAGQAKRITDNLYDEVIVKPDKKIGTGAFQDLADDIKTTSKVEQVVFEDLLDAKKMNPKQILNRRKAIAKINAETSDDIVRQQSRKVIQLIDSIIETDDAFDAAKLADADEAWRFLQALRAGLGQNNQISNQRWTAAMEKYFPREFGLEDVAGESVSGRALSKQGQQAVQAALDIEAAGGVKTPPEGLTAIDFLLGGGALLGGTGAGIFRD